MNRTLIAIIALMVSVSAEARDQIRIVGSSTVFPFVAAAAENYSDDTGKKAPIVESIGTGAGMIEFCKGVGAEFPDIVNASRQIKQSERDMCAANGVGEITEVPLGMDGIVIAGSKKQQPLKLSRKDLFYALAKKVPVNGTLVDNPNTRWKQVNDALPDKKIEVYGPKSTSGTRDAFVETVMEHACIDDAVFTATYADKKERQKACHMIREDGHYIEAGENDNLIVQKLALNESAFGILGFSYLDQNVDKIIAHPIEGVEADYEHIADGSYPVARGLYVYVKNAHFAAIEGLKEFLIELTSEDAISEDGYLAEKGLIAYPEAKQIDTRKRLEVL
jgi:phosphate transport system substrate-binding protein